MTLKKAWNGFAIGITVVTYLLLKWMPETLTAGIDAWPEELKTFMTGFFGAIAGMGVLCLMAMYSEYI